ncbi:MAG: LptF/LptG family permease [Candidatus Latescibacterota bacterium]|nr:MAG: LptF/LptG family permease [Candidatus Latescibacterota bacterium]
MILERYIVRNYIGPFVFSVSVITFLFIMDFILRYIDLFLNKGVEFHIVLQTFILSLGHMFALIIPMAVLPATLMTFGSLASENEITAMKASGVSLYRMIFPGFVLASFLTYGMILYNNHVLPESNHKLLNLLIDINKKKPTVEIKDNVLIDAFEGYKIYVRHKDDKTGEIRDVQIFESDKKGTLLKTITAEKGKLKYLEKDHILRFELETAEIHEIPRGTDPSTYRRSVMRNYIMNIKDIDRSLKRSERTYRGDREMNVKQMQEKIENIRGDILEVRSKMANMATSQVQDALVLLNPTVRDSVLNGRGAAAGTDGANRRPADRTGRPRIQPRVVGSERPAAPPPSRIPSKVPNTRKALESQKEIKDSYLRQINRYRVEIHKKYSIPFACIVFVLIGSPIAIRMGRSGMNMAIGLSILVFLVYYICLIGGEKLADRRILSPVFAMWAPNILFGVAAFLLIRSATREQSVARWRWRNPLKLIRRTS